MGRVVAGIMFAVGVVAMIATMAQAQEDDEPQGPMSNMHFLVLRDYNSKPIKNAAVVLHPVRRNGEQAMGGMELKTDDDGKTGIDGIPYGKLRVQVLAPGFQTFGQDYQVDQAQMEITIMLRRPKRQLSDSGVQEAPKKTDDKKQPNSASPQPQ